MREWLRRLLGRTKLERIESLQRDQVAAIAALRRELPEQNAALLTQVGTQAAERVATLAGEIVRLEQRLLLALEKHQQQTAALATRLEELDAGLAERDQLRQRLQEEQARVRELADQTGHLLTELGAERRASHDARARAEVSDDLRARCDTAERELGVVRRECEGLRADTVRLETACAAADRARLALEAELERVARQRDDLLRPEQAGGAAP